MVAIGWPVKTVEISGCLFAWYPEKNCGIIMNYSPEQHAEAGVLEMGRTWWPSLRREDDRHRWEFPEGVVWFNSIILLDDVENSILRGLKFLDAWTVTGSTDMPRLHDEWGNDWRDITR